MNAPASRRERPFGRGGDAAQQPPLTPPWEGGGPIAGTEAGATDRLDFGVWSQIRDSLFVKPFSSVVMPNTSTGGSKGSAPVIAGRYELLQRAGEGALFDVARARDRDTGQEVAVKILKPALAKDRRFAARLVAEAQATQALKDSRIVSVLDAGQDGGSVCIITEFVEGITLRERIRRTAPLPVAVAVDIAVDIARALTAAHARGIVHGDLRPENVIITADGKAKVTDFGLARALDASSDLQPHSMLRWVQCSSPEATEGQTATPAADTYSLGCILYEMLTGSAVFPGDNAIVVALKHVKDAPRLVDVLNPSVPRSLATLVMRCLEKDPGARYADGAAMLEDLARVQHALQYNKPLDFTPAQVLQPVTHHTRPEPAIEDEEEVPRYLTILRNVMLTLVGVGLVAICVFLYNLLQPQKDVIVPEVIGQNKDVAQQMLLDRGLQCNIMLRESQRPAGEVLSQNPEPNQSVRLHRNVTMYVSKGPRLCIVPPITEMSLDRAREVAAQAGLAVKKNALKHSEDVQKGYVMDQDPPSAEQVSPGSSIRVTVSLGPEPPPPPPPAPETYYPDPNAPPSSIPGGSVAPTGRPRSFKISFQVPTSGYEEPVDMQLVVVDERGETTVADEQRRMGETVTKQVDTVGERVRIRVYLNGKLYSEEIK